MDTWKNTSWNSKPFTNISEVFPSEAVSIASIFFMSNITKHWFFYCLFVSNSELFLLEGKTLTLIWRVLVFVVFKAPQAQCFSFCQTTCLMKRCSRHSRVACVLTSLDVNVRDGGQSPISINQLWSCAVLPLECHLWGHPVIPAQRAWHALTTSNLVGGGKGGEEGVGGVGGIRPGWCPAAIFSSPGSWGGL